MHNQTDETRNKISKSMIGKNNVMVMKYDLDDKFLQNYESITLAAEDVGGTVANIIKCCSGRGVTACGYKWEYTTPPADREKRIKKLKEDKLSSNKKNKKVLKINIQGVIVYEYESITIAAKANDCYAQGISKCCKGINHMYKGFIWEYDEL